METKLNCSASDIYYRILQLGSERVENGISFAELKHELKTECLISNPQNTEHVKQWFDWSFEHKEFGCQCPRDYEGDPCGCNDDDECNKFDHDNLCRRFLTKEALIDFSRLEQSHKYNEKIELYKNQIGLLQTQIGNQKTQIETAERTAKSSSRLAKFALISSIGILLLNSYNSFFKENPLKTSLEQTISNQTETQGILEKAFTNSYKLDSTLLHQKLNEKTNNPEFEEINKTLKSLNWKLLQIKRKIENE